MIVTPPKSEERRARLYIEREREQKTFLLDQIISSM
jgi:hypothetical protein